MVVFASFIGAAAIYAGVASAIPMMDSSSSPSYGSSSPPAYGSSDKSNNYGSSSSTTSWSMSTSTSAAYPESTSSSSSMSYGSGSYGSGYGSGSSNWNKDGYDSCVQQCVAQFGSPGSMYMPPSSTSSGSSGSGNGVTHTVIVAPTQGVLRYVPFALNASVGDTVMFKWGANNHTVTKSSQVELCNKTSDNLFTSGEQNKDFTFTQVINDTNPTFYYCGTPTHCQKGMFGIINPPNAYQQPGSASNMMPSLASQNPSTQAGWSYASNATSNNTAAGNWGMNLDMSKMPDWSMPYMAENILFTRSFLAMNPESMTQDGSVDLSPLANNAVMIPTDVAAAARLNNAESSTPSSTSSGVSSTPSSASSSSGKTNGAGALASPRVAVALVAVVAAFFAL